MRLLYLFGITLLFIFISPSVDVHDVALLKQQLAEMDKTLKTKTLVSIG